MRVHFPAPVEYKGDNYSAFESPSALCYTRRQPISPHSGDWSDNPARVTCALCKRALNKPRKAAAQAGKEAAA